MNGGYLMVSKADTNLYEKLNNALTIGKPVLWYEDENTCYYIDTITKSGTDIILTKGGKTITIENDGDITETGEVQNHLYEYNFRCSFVNEDDNAQCIYFKLLSSLNLEINVDNLKTLISNKYVGVSSSVNSLNDLSTNCTLLLYIHVQNDNIILSSIDDENTIDFTDFNVDTTISTKVQLF